MTHKSISKNNFRIQRTVILSAFLLATLMALLPISAEAKCPQWNVAGVWEIEQRGLSYAIVLTLKQNGNRLTGTAGISTNRGYPAVPVRGTIDGDSVSLKIYWIDGTIGVYDAKFLSSGRLDGNGYEIKSPNITHIWQSRKQFKCPPPPSFNVPLNTYKGKPKPKPVPSPTKPATERPPPPMKVPGILVSQVIYPHDRNPVGFTILTWDSGPDHPYAEVWFSIGGPGVPPVFLVEQGKGSRQIPVERGKYYIYKLTDAGKTLAEVAFVAP